MFLCRLSCLSWCDTDDTSITDMSSDEVRKRIFSSFGASGAQAEALLAYSNSSFSPDQRDSNLKLPLGDEPHIEVWKEYVEQAKDSDVPTTLAQYLVQLNFPIQEGISETADYRAATRRGERNKAPGGLNWSQPNRITLTLHPTAGGRIPVMVCEERSDFETMIRAIVRKNEPKEIPAAMGAAAVKGLNNWSRVHKIKDDWIEQDEQRQGATWNLAFKAVNPSKADYQDTMIILSRGAYSNISAEQVGCSQEEWIQKSLAIRLEHECAHYFCRRVYGSMHNHLRDELVADYAGIVAAEGNFRSDWFLKFMGLNEAGEYDGEGRMKIYRGELDDDCLGIMGRILVAAAQRLQEADSRLEARTQPRPSELVALSDHWLEELADSQAPLIQLG